jgi:hypothetical protein
MRYAAHHRRLIWTWVSAILFLITAPSADAAKSRKRKSKPSSPTTSSTASTQKRTRSSTVHSLKGAFRDYTNLGSTRRGYVPASRYEAVLRNLKRGDTLEFSDGQHLTVGKKLGEGNTTLIFGIKGEPNRALRLAKNDGRYDKIPTRSFLNFFANGHRMLKKLGVPTVRIYGPESKPSDNLEYVIVERLPKGTLFMDELARNPEKIDRKAFRRFFRRTAVLAFLSDFHAGQIAQLPSGEFTLYDWSDPAQNHSAFSHDGSYNERTILDEGLQRIFPGDWLEWDFDTRTYKATSERYHPFADLVNETRTDILHTRKLIRDTPELRPLSDLQLFSRIHTPEEVLAAQKQAIAHAESIGLF